MNALNSGKSHYRTRLREAGSFADDTAAGTLGAREFGIGLQLSRASTMALARLQLAIRSGDRHQAMAAMDRLSALDTELEQLVGRLPVPDNDDPAWARLATHLGDQKLALAFEKLALASEISGPDLVSAAPAPLPLGTVPFAPDEAPPPVPPEWPSIAGVEPAEWKPPSTGILALALALLVLAALAAAALLVNGL